MWDKRVREISRGSGRLEYVRLLKESGEEEDAARLEAEEEKREASWKSLMAAMKVTDSLRFLPLPSVQRELGSLGLLEPRRAAALFAPAPERD